MKISPAEDPAVTAGHWIAAALADSERRNPLALALATATPGGKPSVRMVLAKGFNPERGYVVFYSNYLSRKGRELEANDQAAATFYWEEFGGRQLRLEGRITRSPPQESDAYFATRPLTSRINACVSEQSQPLPGNGYLQAQADALLATHTGADPVGPQRPAHWGGYRLWVSSLEFWLEGEGRFHQRHQFSRTLLPRDGDEFDATDWQHIQLQP